MKWISIEKELPPEHKWVLLTDGEHIGSGFYHKWPPTGPPWCIDTEFQEFNHATHWQKLPRLPRKNNPPKNK